MLLILVSLAHAADVGGYLRVMTRPDFEGGDGKLGYWNLYGRLLNEGPYAALELRQDVLERKAGSTQVWTDLHLKVEGGSIANADDGNGSLAWFRLSQAYAEAGNIGLAGVTWRVGTLEYNYGDLGLYDMRPAQLLTDTVGLSARYQGGPLDLLLAVGDAGYAIHGTDYNSVLTGGGALKLSAGKHFELGAGGQYGYEPEVEGNQYAPYDTPDVSYEDYLRGEVVENWVDTHPGQESDFPSPTPRSASSWKAVAYLGFGNAGPLRWNNFYANVLRHHPTPSTTETYDGETYTIYTTSLTDQRYEVNLGDELQLGIVPQRLDLTLAGLYGNYWDEDNTLAPSDQNRVFYSGVARAQVYMTPHVHLLAESSLAREHSTNGNTYRNHKDSLFANTDGQSDAEGLEYGDAATRDTWQGKIGVVLNPLGPGMWLRPSLRVLYGVQWSSANNAFGNSFVDTLSEYNDFGNTERHWHNVLALETEAWF